jgi:creatinine amidohydrolase
MNLCHRVLALLVLCSAPLSATADVIDAEALTTTQFAALDRSKTAVIVPGGILEEHGPHLPSASDTYQARWLADNLARRIGSRPGWTAVMFPMIPLGHSGANDIPRQWVYPGTVTIRMKTLRAVYMDLADTLGEHGFRYVFLVHIHGAPDHNQALDQAARYFGDTWGGTMVHLQGLKSVNAPERFPEGLVNEAARRADGFTVHAGLSESSRVLFTRPDLIPPSLFSAPALTATRFADLVGLGKTDAWTGYWGNPAASSIALGAALLDEMASRIGVVAEAVLDGKPWDREAFFTIANMDPVDVQISVELRQREAGLEKRQADWLAKNPDAGPATKPD